MNTRVILIARSSKDRHEVSCDSQLAELKAAAVANGEIVVRTLTFPAVRHSDLSEEPEFQELFAEAKDRKRGWEKLWFYDTARLSRDRLKAQTTKALFRRHGIEIEFLKVPATGEEALDNVIEGVFEVFDQLHSDSSRAGAIRGQKQNIRMGFRAGGSAPFGYRLRKHLVGRNAANEEVTKSTLEPDPETFEVVQEYLRRRSAGEKRVPVLKDFDRRGIKTPSGGFGWNPTTGVTIERNLLVYQGHLVYNRHNRKTEHGYVGGQKYRPRSEWLVQEDCHPAAITESEATALEEQLQSRRRNPKKRAPNARKYLLTGLLHCAECGGPMVGDRGQYTCTWRKRGKTDCKNSGIVTHRIEHYVLEHFRDALLSKSHFDAVVEAVRESYAGELADSSATERRLRERLDVVEGQIDRLVQLYALGTIDAASIERQAAPLNEEKADLEAEMSGASRLGTALECAAEVVTEKTVRRYVERFAVLLDEETQDEMRAFLGDFVDRIELHGTNGGRQKPRKVLIHGTSPEFSRIGMASPTGLEPVLPP